MEDLRIRLNKTRNKLRSLKDEVTKREQNIEEINKEIDKLNVEIMIEENTYNFLYNTICGSDK